MNWQQDKISAPNSHRIYFLNKITPKFVQEAKELLKQKGLRAVVKHYGWKLFALFFIYYLVRDTLIYLILPYLIARGFMN